ncbi:MAG: WD40 repeat domain-containing protein, partial [Deltaproteobacteria bacterium]|nr:WD40 repeat domain-containing protein [Deltaproteobacteria bacterium]
GTILKSDGGVWKPMASGSTSDLFSVWGSSATDLFAVGADGTILHGDGSVWVPMESGTTADLRGIYGSSKTDIVIVGDGVILKYSP